MTVAQPSPSTRSLRPFPNSASPQRPPRLFTLLAPIFEGSLEGRGTFLTRICLARGCKNTETATLTTFRINTCKSVSKQRTLTTFRINTCEKQGGGGLELYTVSRPTSPACLESGLPIHTTLHRTALSGSSSRISSTACPRLSRKLPCSRNPRSEASTTRQGILIWFRSRLMIRLARFFAAIRLRRRPSGTGNVGISVLSGLG